MRIMSFKKLGRAVRRVLGRPTSQDRLKAEIRRWRRDGGDERLRHQFPLDARSVVWDVGGFEGDFAAAVQEQYGCTVHLFEPVASFHARCEERFRSVDRVACHPYGLSDRNGHFDISLEDNASSFHPAGQAATVERAELRCVTEVFEALGLEWIDLIKMNIEGGEFEVLPALLDSGLIRRVRHLMVQFHGFMPQAQARRDSIRARLAETHREMWNYEFVWESWELKA